MNFDSIFLFSDMLPIVETQAMIQPMDWSATAAWIALVISVLGTFAGPLITTFLTNRHQLKLRNLDMQQEVMKQYENRRFEAFNAFLHNVGGCLSRFDVNDLAECGASFHCVYQYVPTDFWPELDKLYDAIVDTDWDAVKQLYPPIARKLNEISKETHLLHP